MFYKAIVFLPLLGAIAAGLLSLRKLDGAAITASVSGVCLSFILSCFAFGSVALGGEQVIVDVARWIGSGDFQAHWTLRFDTLTAVMLIVVTGVSSCVHIYSIGYMHHDKAIARFMAYLSLFTFAMLMLVTADNLVQLFFGWEGVGVASYLLIGFWYHKESAHTAAMKAFVVNRVGDFGFVLGILAIFALTGSVSFDAIFASVADYQPARISIFGVSLPALEVVSVLLFVGAMGKSAQLGLHTWLPDAMEGPTPVSALIHAATMVTAGVFLVCRMSPVIEYAPVALDIITLVGALTAIFAATVGMTQFDIKRVIAYSTCSQLGYMFFAAGVSAYPAAMFHLTTHAFFKALLFLGAGSVIHALSNEQDLRKMGGIWRQVPVTYTMMWIGSLALAGFPFFAGFYSKDMILEAAYGAHTGIGMLAFWLGCAAALLTAFYSWRLLILAFHGTPRASDEVMAHVHESPNVMTLPLVPLALGAIFAGWMGYDLFVGHHWQNFWGSSIFILPSHGAMEAAHHVPTWVKLLPIGLASAGVVGAYIAYARLPWLPISIAERAGALYRFLFNKWYFDELYDRIFVGPAVRIGRLLWVRGDKGVIDHYGPDGLSSLVARLSGRLVQIQTGYVYHYAFAMMIGVVVLLTWYFSGFGG
ncbi:proton-translocating NADH-quinone oxidoreductase, chain L [SAR116 cluster alpha proteobacterium HIMB100]|nr:proton-translocating NADH-quinone oxidoreductase, chain L [SAR116 cluster alpha proteobacterium HIMB100]